MPLCCKGSQSGLKIRWLYDRVGSSPTRGTHRKYGIVAVHQPSKLDTGVRLSLLAPNPPNCNQATQP